MDVAGALVEGVLPQPVDDLDHALVVGVELLVALAELDQLLEAGARRDLAGLLRRAHRLAPARRTRSCSARSRAGWRPRGLIVLRVCASISATQALSNGSAGGDRDLAGADLQRQRAAALGVVDRHHVGDAADVDLQRVDAQVGQAARAWPAIRSAPRCRAACRRRAHQARRCRAAPADAARCRPARARVVRWASSALITPSSRSHSSSSRQSSGPPVRRGCGRRRLAATLMALHGQSRRTGLIMRSHFLAGRPQRLSMFSARAASSSRVGQPASRSASTTVLPSRVGLQAQTRVGAEGRGDAAGAALEARVAAEQVDRHHAAVGQQRAAVGVERRRRRAPARRPRGRTGRRQRIALPRQCSCAADLGRRRPAPPSAAHRRPAGGTRRGRRRSPAG